MKKFWYYYINLIKKKLNCKGRDKIVKNIIKSILDKKGEDITILNLKKLNTFTDYFILCTATSEKHAQTIADAVLEAVERESFLGMEGYQQGKWILIDCDEVVVHVFQKETREFYDIEGLWYDAEREKLEDYGF